MKWSKEIKVRLIAIPLVSLLISLMLVGEKSFSSGRYFFFCWMFSCLVTFIVWSGNIAILNWLHQKYPLPSQTFKRTFSLLLTIGIYSSLAFCLTECVVAFFLQIPISWKDLIPGLQITFAVTIPVTLLYESYFFYRNWEKASLDAEKLKKENIQAQLESLRNQVNPHFLFNSLNTLVSIIPDCPETAMDFVHKLSHVYRYLLNMKEKELVSLEIELDFITSYLFLLQVRFGENLRVEINVSEESREMCLPPVSLQLLIENAIKHNVVSADKPLYLRIYSENDRLIVQNNLQPKQQIEESTGTGLENIRKRYEILSNSSIEALQTKEMFVVSLPLLPA